MEKNSVSRAVILGTFVSIMIAVFYYLLDCLSVFKHSSEAVAFIAVFIRSGAADNDQLPIIIGHFFVLSYVWLLVLGIFLLLLKRGSFKPRSTVFQDELAMHCICIAGLGLFFYYIANLYFKNLVACPWSQIWPNFFSPLAILASVVIIWRAVRL